MVPCAVEKEQGKELQVCRGGSHSYTGGQGRLE